MSNIKELDDRLRAFINEPENFIGSVALVDVLHSIPVLASDQPYAIEIEDYRVTPVFTDKKDLDNFKLEQESAQNQNWIERTVFSVLEEVISTGLSGLVFNVKKTGDFSNSTIFKSSELIQFMNTYATILNKVMGDKNQIAETMNKYYLVPAFIRPSDKATFDRLFPTLATAEGKKYVPAFSNLESFAKWYEDDNFGVFFRQAHGSIVTWTIDDIYKPRNGENNLNEVFGVAINPFDDQQILIDWSEIE